MMIIGLNDEKQLVFDGVIKFFRRGNLTDNLYNSLKESLLKYFEVEVECIGIKPISDKNSILHIRGSYKHKINEEKFKKMLQYFLERKIEIKSVNYI